MQINHVKNIGIFDVLRVSTPMIISSFSTSLMLILDQLILAHYSIDAMTGASAASVWCMMMQFSSISVTMIAGTIVGNYNGAGRYELCGVSVWQMIWFSVAIFAVSIPVAIFGGEYCVPKTLHEGGLMYFKLIMMCSPLVVISYTISAFFVSTWMGNIVTTSILIANVVNFVVDILLVFDHLGIGCCTGSTGAAIGTITAWLTNITILSFHFFKREIRIKYGTQNFRLQLTKLREYLKLGATAGIGHIIEMSAWGVLYHLLANTNKEMAVIQSVAVSVSIFSSFVVAGLEKSILAMTANLLGKKLQSKVNQVLRGGVCIHITYVSIIAVIFVFAPNVVIDSFIRFDVSADMLQNIKLILRFVLVYLLFDGISWVVAGAIEGGGDINFTMLSFATCIWTFVTIPSIVLYNLGILDTAKAWTFLDMAVAVIALILYRRYRSGKWIRVSGICTKD